MSQEKIDQFYGEWYEHPDLQDLAPEEFQKRIRDVLDALDDYNRKDRPLNILAVHGSGRHRTVGCARSMRSVRRTQAAIQKGIHSASRANRSRTMMSLRV